MGKVLIIDDDKLGAQMLCDMVRLMGHEAAWVSTGEEGYETARSRYFDVVFLDVRLPDCDGLTLLPAIRATPSAPEVIIITGFGSADGAELAVRNGAWDFIEKPLVRKSIELPLLRALQYREVKKERRVPLALKRDNIVGSSPAMQACLDLIAQAASSDTTVLIGGETGTGKELFANAIHANSARCERPFVTVDCASLPPNLIESILFGHEKGAFTGADKPRDGLVKQADGGTLFLDEIGELPLVAQKTFLRVLQERSFRPVGGKREIKSDFRMIAVTNRDLEAMVQEKKFREDLLFRLRAFVITLPPLREHPADINELVLHYVNKFCRRQGGEVKGFSPEFLEALDAYAWPGNVRELVNAIDSALAASFRDPILFPKHLPMHIRVALARNAVREEEKKPSSPKGAMVALKEHREAAVSREEMNYLMELMAVTGGDLTKACAIAGLSRVRLYVLLNKYKIARPAVDVSSDETGFARRKKT